MTRFAWLTLALIALPVGCTLLADNALPDASPGGGGAGAMGGSDPTTGGGGTSAGTATGAEGGGGTGGEGGGGCEPTASDESNCFDSIDNDCNGSIDCNDSACTGVGQCTDEVPQGVTFVLAGLESCPSGYMPLDLQTCSDCSCNVADDGTCQYETSLYPDATCSGTPLDTALVAEAQCVAVNATVSSGTVWATATPVPLDPPTCENGTPVAPGTKTVCQAIGVGACGNGTSCVPEHEPTTTCILLDGDVTSCPDTRPNRELVFVGGSGNCPCTCGPAGQDCSGVNHTHAYNMDACVEPPNYTTIEQADGCKDMGHASIQSLDNHDPTMAASNGVCESKAGPAEAETKTLCCSGS